MKSDKWGLWLPLATAAIVLALAVAFVVPELSQIEPLDLTTAVLAWITLGLWLLLMTWSVYQAMFQLLGVIVVPPETSWSRARAPSDVRFAVFYLTCDDFLPDCCATCLNQSLPAQNFQVVICDDSRRPEFQAIVDEFCRQHDGVQLARRADREGFKAGNLNAAFHQFAKGRSDWIVLVDADQALPQDYLEALSGVVARLPAEVAYVQAGRMPLDPDHGAPRFAGGTPFQQAMQPEMLLFFGRELAWRDKLGFSPFLGHGGAIRQSAWQAIEGFPCRVSEDVAFSMRALEQGYRGARTDVVRSFEAYPYCFHAFLVRLCKFNSGAAELWRRDLMRFLLSRVTITEKVDSIAWLATYLLPPVFLVNSLLSGFVAWRLNQDSANLIAWGLSLLFGGLVLSLLAAAISVVPSVAGAVRYWFWAFAVYMAALPVAAGAFVKSLLGTATFHRTPKVSQAPINGRPHWPVMAIGVVWIAAGIGWWSPFSPIPLAMGTAFASAALYDSLHEATALGRIARTLVYLPGALFLWGLMWMWWEA